MKTSKSLLALIVVVIMFSSTLFFGFNKQKKEEPQYPDRLVYLEELSEETENSFIRSGFTVGRYYYPPLCVECGQFISQVENAIINEFDKQFILEKIQVESYNKTLPYMKLKSIRGIEEEEGINNITVFYEAACKVLLNPPPDCIDLG